MTPGNRQQCSGANSSGMIILRDKRKMLLVGKPLSSERGLLFFKHIKEDYDEFTFGNCSYWRL